MLRVVAARAAVAAFGGGVAYVERSRCEQESTPGLPVYSREEIRKHAGGGSTWVTYKDGVYDISEFINAHPGGAQKIRLAAGGSVEPFWCVFVLASRVAGRHVARLVGTSTGSTWRRRRG